jgi:arabinogalactan endo-1,4-beta-galactosidase
MQIMPVDNPWNEDVSRRPRLTNSDAMIAQMVVEVGGEDTQVENTHAMLLAVQQKVRDVPDGKGLGVIYWEPQAARSWSRYKLSCWGEDGKPTTALRAFLPDAGRDALKLQSR